MAVQENRRLREMADIKRACTAYGITEILAADLLSSGYANRNYRIKTDKGVFLYRVYLQQEDASIIEYEVRVLEQLKRQQFPAAYPIPREDGGYLTRADGAIVMLYEFKPGREPDLTPETVAAVARCIARLNRFEAYEQFPRKNSIHMDHCLALMDRFSTAPCQYPDIFRYFEEQTLYLKEKVAVPLPRGLIHGDVFPDNTLFQGSRLVALIDFEEVCVDHLLMEVAMCINGFCFVDNSLDTGLAAILVREYHRIRPMTGSEFGLLYDYIQWAAHGTLSWHLRYHLIRRENSRQLERACTLMERVKKLRRQNRTDFERQLP